jgi:hypothetical protein
MFLIVPFFLKFASSKVFKAPEHVSRIGVLSSDAGGRQK